MSENICDIILLLDNQPILEIPRHQWQDTKAFVPFYQIAMKFYFSVFGSPRWFNSGNHAFRSLKISDFVRVVRSSLVKIKIFVASTLHPTFKQSNFPILPVRVVVLRALSTTMVVLRVHSGAEAYGGAEVPIWGPNFRSWFQVL